MIGYNQIISIMIYEKTLEIFSLKQGQDKDSYYYHYQFFKFSAKIIKIEK